MAHSNL